MTIEATRPVIIVPKPDEARVRRAETEFSVFRRQRPDLTDQIEATVEAFPHLEPLMTGGYWYELANGIQNLDLSKPSTGHTLLAEQFRRELM